jgi:hypothetical protein
MTKGDWQRSWRDVRRIEAVGHLDVIYAAPGLNFYHTKDHFLSMEKILKQKLITWEIGREPSLLVIRTSFSNVDISGDSAKLGSYDLLALLYDHRRRSIRRWVIFSTWLVRFRLRRFVTRAKGPFQLGGMIYEYEPDFSKYINS